MRYQIVVTKKAQKGLNKIPNPYYQKIIAAFAILGNDPFCGKKLVAKHKGEWSFRVWPYRIIYKIKNLELVVLIVKVGHRQGVY